VLLLLVLLGHVPVLLLCLVLRVYMLLGGHYSSRWQKQKNSLDM
jgi:hypothetical protein